MNGRLILLRSNLFIFCYTKSCLNKYVIFLLISTLTLLSGCQLHSDQKNEMKNVEGGGRDGLLDVTVLEEGDILLREGNGFVSSLIIKSLNEDNKVSHAGLVVNLNRQLVVFHTLPEVDSLGRNVRFSSVNEFGSNHEALKVYVCRPLNCSPVDSGLIHSCVLKLLVQNPPFDPFSNVNTKDKLSCSELAYRVMMALNYLPINISDSLRETSTPFGFKLFFDKRFFKVIFPLPETKEKSSNNPSSL